MSERTSSAKQITARLIKLKRGRKRRHVRAREEGRRRGALTPRQRRDVLAKTAGRCHVCGGTVDGAWHADHVLAHSGGGRHRADNFLAAHRLCNTYRWDYSPGEFQLILKLGGWIANEIRRSTPVGRAAADGFVKKERRRAGRAKRSA
ncbi:HNH endonuclease [bacterium]|nr:HNH endonuclease [bacterium]